MQPAFSYDDPSKMKLLFLFHNTGLSASTSCPPIVKHTNITLHARDSVFFFHGGTAPTEPWPPRDHTHTLSRTPRGRVINSKQRILPTTKTQHSLEKDIHAPRRDSNPYSQQVGGRSHTPYAARPLGSARMEEAYIYVKLYPKTRTLPPHSSLQGVIICFGVSDLIKLTS
jgi:hypothetical protein